MMTVVTLVGLVLRFAVLVLRETGVPRRVAWFQVVSALTGTGFTTEESEAVVASSLRRWVMVALMVLGSGGLLAVVATVILAPFEMHASSLGWAAFGGLVLGLAGLWWLALSRWSATRVRAWVRRRMAAEQAAEAGWPEPSRLISGSGSGPARGFSWTTTTTATERAAVMDATQASLKGRVALVTGGAHGIGFACVRCLSATGFDVAVLDRDAGKIEAAKVAMRRDRGPEAGRLAWHVVDVGDVAALGAAVSEVIDDLGRLDAIVNNAGLGRHGSAEALSLEDWNAVLAVNLTAAWLTVKHAAAALRASPGGGSVVNIASTRAHMSEPNTLPYAASKAGLVGLTHALAISLGPAVRVNCISPGWIDTRGYPRREGEPTPEPYDAPHHAQHPAGRIGTPGDIAAMTLHLCDPARGGFITGQEFVIDGGMTRKMIYGA